MRKKRVLFVGASGYGNIGDDTYPLVFKRYLADSCKLFFMNSDPNPIPNKLDLIVIGGGGLIWDKENDLHFDYMKRYVDHAIRYNIPYGFISVGIQSKPWDWKSNKYHGWDAESSNNVTWDFDSTALRWLPLLKGAAFATFRDAKSLEYFKIKFKSRPKTSNNFYHYPDLCYLYNWACSIKSMEQRKFITVIPYSGANKARFGSKIDDAIQKYPDAEILALGMGSAKDDDPGIKEIGELYPDSRLFFSEDVSPDFALSVISRSHFVGTARYHGLIFSRICNTPYTTAKGFCQYKIQEEDRDSNMSLAIKNIYLLKNKLGLE